MSVRIPEKAFILAAGHGTRLRPHTDHCPKPMVQVGGRSLIYRTLDKLCAAGVREAVVNTHYMAEMLEEHLAAYRNIAGGGIEIHISREPEILDTGGGVVNALDHFGNDPFFVIAGDGLWMDAPGYCSFGRLAQNWDDESMDILTLMQPLSGMVLTQGAGDYDIDATGGVRRSLSKTGSYMWTNIRLNHPRIYKGAPQGAFSFLPIMDACEAKGTLRALLHQGDWHHISTPKDLEAVDKVFYDHGW